jgi:methionine sulfoxide reductase heme-binding subunit
MVNCLLPGFWYFLLPTTKYRRLVGSSLPITYNNNVVNPNSDFVMDTPPLENSVGLAALICYALTLLPTILKILFREGLTPASNAGACPKGYRSAYTPRQTKTTAIYKWLLQNRRQIGVLCFFLTAIHGYPYLHKRNLDVNDAMTYLIYIQGVSAFVVLLILAVTSNNWSVKKLKQNWKHLHKLSYTLIFMLTWHIWDKMSGHWTYLTPVSLVIMAVIAILFSIRVYREYTAQRQKHLARSQLQTAKGLSDVDRL